jgi:hypothetical protein
MSLPQTDGTPEPEQDAEKLFDQPPSFAEMPARRELGWSVQQRCMVAP